MTLDRLTVLADAWGGDLRRWPPADRIEAEQLLASDPEARAVLEAATAFDALLSTSPQPRASAALRDRGLTTHRTADIQADAVLYQATLAGVDDTEVLG